jgi:hypothetical protein
MVLDISGQNRPTHFQTKDVNLTRESTVRFRTVRVLTSALLYRTFSTGSPEATPTISNWQVRSR